MRNINDRDVLFFGNKSRDPSQSLNFFDSAQTKTNIFYKYMKMNCRKQL